MRRRRLGFLLLAAIGLGAYASMLPPKSRSLAPPPASMVAVRGSMHVHTRRSDGAGTVEEVAAAAARAGLDFVVITDHGDATAKPNPPAYYGRVLVIDAVEVSTLSGHVVALGMPQAPYPLRGEPRDVVEDIHRLGGFAIAAHPDSMKVDLRWSDWKAPIDGVEWLNADSAWRDESTPSLLRSLLTYPVRPAESIAALFDRPDAMLAQWDAQTQTRQVIGVAAPDAHARIGLSSLGEPYESAIALRIPSYEAMFRAFSLVTPGVTLSREAATDATAIVAAIRAGHVYSALDAIARPGAVAFTAQSGRYAAAEGDLLPLDGPVTLRIEMAAPAEAIIAVVRDGKVFRLADGSPLVETMPAEPAVYRVEVRLPGAPGQPAVPWLLTNPIYVGPPQAPASTAAVTTPARTVQVLYDDGATPGARTEQGGQAQVALEVVPAAPQGHQLLFRYAIGGRASESPYAAAVFAATRTADFDRVLFTARADHPMRLAVQLRVPGGPAGERWQRSVYVDETMRSFSIPFADMTAVAGARRGAPPLADIDSLLLVVDGMNTKLGGNGTVWIDEIKFGR